MSHALAKDAVPAVLETHEIGEGVVRRPIPDLPDLHQFGLPHHRFRCKERTGPKNDQRKELLHGDAFCSKDADPRPSSTVFSPSDFRLAFTAPRSVPDRV